MHIATTQCKPESAGVDLNRNYGYAWENPNGDVGQSECQGDTYHGTKPFSEPET